MLTLKDRILLVEDDFLSALSGGEDAVVAFNERWEALTGEADQILESTGLDKETSELLHTVAFRIATLADASAEIFDRSDSITSDLLSQIEDLVPQMTLEDRPSTSTLSYYGTLPSSHSPTPSGSFSHVTTSEQQWSRKRRRVSDDISPQAKRKRTPPPIISSQSSKCHDLHVPTRKRKRCVSEVDSPAPSCPSKRLYAGPRLHAVSDSFPILWSTPSNGSSRPSSPDTCFDASGWLDVLPLTSPSSAQCDSEPNHPTDGFDSVNYFTPPLEPNALDQFLTSLVESKVSPSFDFSAALTESEHPSSCHSPSSSSISSRSSPTPSPLATPPSSPRLDPVALDISVHGCQPNVSLLQADRWLTCPTSHFDDPSTFLPSDFSSESGWETLLELDPSVWIIPPSQFPIESYEVTLGNHNLLQPAMIPPA